MSTNKNVPEIRFQGFIEPWDEKELGELADIVRGASPRPIEDPKWFDSESNVGWLRIRDVTKQDGRIHYLKQRISKLGQDQTRVLRTEHLLLSIAASVGKPVINYVETGVHDGFLIFKKPLFNNEYMYQWLKSFEQKWLQYGQPGSQVNLNSDIVKNHQAHLPRNIEEQTQIGNYFQNLDGLINQHKKKHEKLSNVKRSMLEKMLPKVGETVPEIRFEGAVGEWEVKKIIEICSISTGKNNTQDKVAEGKYPFYVRSANIERSNNYLFDEEAVLTIGDGVGTGKVYHYVNGKYDLHQRVYRMFDFSGVSAKYFYHYFSNNFYNRVMSMTAKTSVDSVRLDMIASMDIFIPTLIEQKKIANLLDEIDKLTEQHHQQIKKLNNIKQACLNKMFV